MKSLLPGIPVEDIVERYQAHPDVMSHVCTDDCFSAPRQWTCVIDRITEAEWAQSSFRFERREIAHRLMWLDLKSKCCRVWGDNEILAQPALQCQVGDTEPSILIRV